MTDNTGGINNHSAGYWPNATTAYPNYPNTHTFGGYPALWPSHVTHSWSIGGGLGGDPMQALAKAMDRLAAAIEKHNELAGK